MSCLETGKSRPSIELVLRLAQRLEVPESERNALLGAADFAPAFRETGLDQDAEVVVDEALQTLLDHHQPYPATVLDRFWNLRLANVSALRVLGRFIASHELRESLNVMELCFDPAGLRPAIENWHELAPRLLGRVRAELRLGAEEPMQELLARLYRYPGVRELTSKEAIGPPVFSLRLRSEDLTLKLVTVVATLGTAPDIASREYRLELYYPADAASREAMVVLSH